MHTSPPPRPTATRRAYDFAKWAILNGTFLPGTLVTEARLAEETGLSRTPVREALLLLEAEGLVRVIPRRGAEVVSYTEQDVDHVLEARAVIERHTAGQSFAHRKSLLPALEEVHASMRLHCHRRDVAAFTDGDRTFHELIVDAAGNGVLSQIYRVLRERQTLFTSAVIRGHADKMRAALVEHDRILAVLAGDDENAFRSVVDGHLQWSAAMAKASR